MAWKQRRGQYQNNFLILNILSKKWKPSIMQIKYWNPRKTESKLSELYQEDLIVEYIQYQTWYMMS